MKIYSEKPQKKELILKLVKEETFRGPLFKVTVVDEDGDHIANLFGLNADGRLYRNHAVPGMLEDYDTSKLKFDDGQIAMEE